MRRADAFASSPIRIAGALWRDHMRTDEWLQQLPDRQSIVVYCTHGHNVSEIAAARLAAAGADAGMLEGGIEAWTAAGGPPVAREAPGSNPACRAKRLGHARAAEDRPHRLSLAHSPLHRSPGRVPFRRRRMGEGHRRRNRRIPFDIKDVHYSHRGEECTFDTLISEFGLSDPALLHLARIVRGADTARMDLEPQAAGLLAVSLGLSAIEDDDLAQLEKGMVIYDALYGWCRYATAETHNWPVKAA